MHYIYILLAIPCIFAVLMSAMAINVVATRSVAHLLDLSERAVWETTLRGGFFTLLISAIIGISCGGSIPYLDVPIQVLACIAIAVGIGVSYPILLLLAVGLCRFGACIDRIFERRYSFVDFFSRTSIK